ncbi:hypothetical protein BHE74_00014562 [Ensete ventricosum]|uniref:Uncharacterized protein n=1 Tax=Ensete ventricosum TaxID=4639 RepID=A0A426ZIV4_ENSVE|nr:hypothetical protein B296_00010614 [Ensete ventricosum]RWV99795.1 hypothetical protein GW17_00037280 [Ensete ventricosum]RWW77294.1 hypothetical protein BHE74_00014562 [Ensete ventricosum]RZS00232.1 hypothetical protein BHM03_00029905 [Ensete ventricosum]
MAEEMFPCLCCKFRNSSKMLQDCKGRATWNFLSVVDLMKAVESVVLNCSTQSSSSR